MESGLISRRPTFVDLAGSVYRGTCSVLRGDYARPIPAYSRGRDGDGADSWDASFSASGESVPVGSLISQPEHPDVANFNRRGIDVAITRNGENPVERIKRAYSGAYAALTGVAFFVSLAVMWTLDLTIHVPRSLWGIYGGGCVLIFLSGALAGYVVKHIRAEVEGVETISL